MKYRIISTICLKWKSSSQSFNRKKALRNRSFWMPSAINYFWLPLISVCRLTCSLMHLDIWYGFPMKPLTLIVTVMANKLYFLIKPT